jgi:hypothetical protein
LQLASDLSVKPFAGSYVDKVEVQKELVEQLKVAWKLLWSECFNDRVRAEDISVKDYESLLVERGTIIQATRNFKVLAFKEILETHMIENPERYLQPDAKVGGWHKFIKTEITSHKQPTDKHLAAQSPKKQEMQQAKKGGRGWLHSQ